MSPQRAHLLWIAPIILGFLAAPSTLAEDRRWDRPRYVDKRLDICLTWGANCGQPVAQQFCHRKKYRSAADFGTERIGDREPTRLWRSNAVCRGSFCTGFTHITCRDRFPDSQVFVNPAWNGQRLDNCERWAQDCGKPAADAFCRAQGFGQSAANFPDGEPGYSKTIVISSGQICDGPGYVGFQMIICD